MYSLLDGELRKRPQEPLRDVDKCSGWSWSDRRQDWYPEPMPGNIGWLGIVIILLVLLLIFGPKRLPGDGPLDRSRNP